METHPRRGEEALPQTLADNIAAREKVSLSAMVARSFVKFDIGLRARLLGRLLASVGPLALKVVSGGVFANGGMGAVKIGHDVKGGSGALTSRDRNRW